MDKFEKDKNIMLGKGEDDKWITTRNGVHVPVGKNESKKQAIENHFKEINEFRYLEKHKDPKKHPAHLYARNEDNVKYNQLTHAKFIPDSHIPNKKLHDNPNPKDKEDSYVLRKSFDGKISDFGKPNKNWRLSKENEKIMKKFRDKLF